MALQYRRVVEPLEARVSAAQKELPQRAAERTVHEHEVPLLTPQESREFVEALLNAPAANAALRAAATHYQRVMAER